MSININKNKPNLWKTDIKLSVDMYNSWFMKFAPKTFRDERVQAEIRVAAALSVTQNLTAISPNLLKEKPSVLSMLRMSTCPPIARDRLIGLAGVSKNLVESMEDADRPRIPPRMPTQQLDLELRQITKVIRKMADPDIFVWLARPEPATDDELSRAASVVADRLCGAVSDPIVRNAQEKRQLSAIEKWLKAKGYKLHVPTNGINFSQIPAGTYAFRMNVPVNIGTNKKIQKQINIPIDVVIMPKQASAGGLPLLIEAKSAGDFTNVNKRRKEEAQKMSQLKNTYGSKIRFGLFLCGYFDSGYLGYEASEGIDWVWEHRINDLAKYGL